MRWTRREALGLLTAFGGLGLAGGCGGPPGDDSFPSPTGKIIDGHCHAFNASDLSPTRFIRYAVLERYPGPEEARLLQVEEPDLLDGIIETLLTLLGAASAPRATEEIAFLDGRAAGDPVAVTRSEVNKEAVDSLANFLKTAPSIAFDDESKPYLERGKAFVYHAVLDTAGTGARLRPNDMSPEARKAIAENFVEGNFETAPALLRRGFNLWQVFQWVALFRRYRHSLVDELVSRHRASAWNPVLLAPATVDFGRFVREEPTSPLCDQVSVWSRIAKRPAGPAVHGYVAFCPLRQALHRRSVQSRLRDGREPLSVVSDALERRGFLGVKLYPPMGFQPSGNAARDFGRYPFSDDVLRDRFGDMPTDRLQAHSPELGAEIDQALADLYDLCANLDAPIMAHGGHGNAVKQYYGEFSDPWLWRDVFKGPRQRPLRIMLAHYGGFNEPSQDPGGLTTPWNGEDYPMPIERTKEGSIARHLTKFPQSPVFVDVSFLSEVLTADGTERDWLVEAFTRFGRSWEDHIVFGTDWLMLGIQKGEKKYNAAIQHFWTDCGFSDIQISKFIHGNFVRYAGLERSGATRERLDRFNASYGAPDRLAVLDGI